MVMRPRLLPVIAVTLLVAIGLAAPTTSGQTPAGTTNAVLSYVDAAGGHVSVVRHWHGPGTGEDTQVFPQTPYFWDGCLPFQNGALMFLVTSPVGYPPPGLTSAEAYTTQYLARVGQALGSHVAASAAQLSADESQGRANLERIAAGLTTPGDPAYEALKAAVGQINSLSNYEDYGYATFMFIRWKWVFVLFGAAPVACADVQVRTVPEGYAIPIITRRGGGASDVPRAWWDAAVLAGRR